jgi:kynurenine formamidase
LLNLHFLSHPLLLLEDMDLAEINTNNEIRRLIIAPLRVKAADGTPCTVLGEITK